MISAWHLLWIMPLSVFLGFFCAAMLHAAHEGERDE